jgi:alcohol dehydrogenase class IV
MGYPLTVFHKIPHGLASAILMPRFLKFLEKKSKSKTKLNTLHHIFEPVNGLDSFLSSLNISTDLSDYGVKKEKISLFVKKTIVKSDIQITPAPVREADIEDIYNLD